MLILISISTIPIGTTVPTATDFSQQRAESTVLSDDILTLSVLVVELGSPVGEGGRVGGYHPAVERCRRSSATATSVSEAEPAEAMVSVRCRVLRRRCRGQVRRGDWVSSRHDALILLRSQGVCAKSEFSDVTARARSPVVERPVRGEV
jgi:hypothetical protein